MCPYFLSQIEASGSLQWSLHRRYSSFRTMHQNLKAEGLHQLPALPERTLVQRAEISTEFLEHRRQALEKYLQELLHTRGVVESSHFADFTGAIQFTQDADQKAR